MVEGAKLFERIFVERLHDIDLQLWLVEKFWLKNREELLLFLEFASNDDIFTPCGRRLLSVEERQRVYDFWKLNSEVSVHRSNDHHLVKINLENVRPQVADLEDDNISLINTKRGEKEQAHKRVATKYCKTLHSDYNYKQIYGSEISYGSFINLKPLYVPRSTDKETEMCLCSKCLNPHCLYKANKTNVNTDLPKSQSDDLCKNFKCDREPETNFFHRDCTLGKCQNKCEILSTSDDLKDQRLDEDKKVV